MGRVTNNILKRSLPGSGRKNKRRKGVSHGEKSCRVSEQVHSQRPARRVKRRSDAIVIGQVLRMMREKRKLSQAEIAERMGLKQPAIARLERQSDFKLSTLQEWAVATGGELILAVRRRGKLSQLVG
jgi:ribosome-binding protein aMBF1 (putative translation factor)